MDTVHHWVGFELEGRGLSPGRGRGARGGALQARTFHRTDAAFIGYSYSSCGPLTFNFGLGDRAVGGQSVEVFWPSGIRTILVEPGPAIDQYHTLCWRRPALGLAPGFGLAGRWP